MQQEGADDNCDEATSLCCHLRPCLMLLHVNDVTEVRALTRLLPPLVAWDSLK